MTTFLKPREVSAEILARIQAIQIANGAETDIGVKTMRGRTKVPGDDEVPCCQIAELPDEVENRPERTTRVKLSRRFYIDAFDTCDPDNPNEKADAMIRDMKRAIFGDGATFGNKVYDVIYVGMDVGPRADGAGFVQARISFDVQWAEDLSKP